MKKSIMAIAIAVMMLLPATVMAAGSVTVTYTQLSGNVSKLSFAWTADAANGTVPDTATDAATNLLIKGMMAQSNDTKPGATAPTNNYSITIENSLGIDVLGGSGASRSSTTAQRATVLAGGAFNVSPIDGNGVTFKLTGNVVNSATGVDDLYLVR